MHTKYCSEKIERKRPRGRPRCTLEDNIRIDLGELGTGLDASGLG
jgi:hypothetical protein